MTTVVIVSIIALIVLLVWGVAVPFAFATAIIILMAGLGGGYRPDYMLTVGYSSLSSRCSYLREGSWSILKLGRV